MTKPTNKAFALKMLDELEASIKRAVEEAKLRKRNEVLLERLNLKHLCAVSAWVEPMGE